MKSELLHSKKGLTKLQAIVLIAVVIVAIIVAGVIYYYTTLPKAKEIYIKVGIIMPLTGSLAPLGKPTFEGIKAAIDLINERGGVLGKYPVKYVVADSQSSPAVAKSEAERLCTTEGVQIIIGSYSSGLASTVVKVTEQYHVVLWETGGTFSPLTLQGYKYLLRPLYVSEDWGALGVFYLKDVVAPKLGKDPKDIKVVLLHEDSAFGQTLASGVKAACAKYGFNLIAVEPYPYTITDMSGIITKLKGLKFDVLLHAGYFTDTVLFLRQAKELGLKFPVIIGYGVGYGIMDLWKTFGKDIEYFNVIDWPNFYFVDFIKDPKIREIAEEFKKRAIAYFGEEWLSDTHVYTGFALALPLFTHVLPYVIEKYGEVTPDNIMKAAYEIKVPKEGDPYCSGIQFSSPEKPSDTWIGKIIRPENPQLHIGQNIVGTYYGYQWINGKLIPVWPSEFKKADPVIPLPKTSPFAPP
jgi:branched-chain amino acid transport system substrate-binding protein